MVLGGPGCWSWIDVAPCEGRMDLLADTAPYDTRLPGFRTYIRRWWRRRCGSWFAGTYSCGGLELGGHHCARSDLQECDAHHAIIVGIRDQYVDQRPLGSCDSVSRVSASSAPPLDPQRWSSLASGNSFNSSGISFNPNGI